MIKFESLKDLIIMYLQFRKEKNLKPILLIGNQYFDSDNKNLITCLIIDSSLGIFYHGSEIKNNSENQQLIEENQLLFNAVKEPDNPSYKIEITGNPDIVLGKTFEDISVDSILNELKKIHTSL